MVSGYSVFFLVTVVSALETVCKLNEVLFMGKCWCEPGWEAASDTGSLSCSTPILKNGDCECEPNDVSRSFLKNHSWHHPTGYRCESLCRWNSQVGVPRSLPSEWSDNQDWKQLPFYMKDLPRKRHTHMRGRLDEFGTAFNQFAAINHTDLGRVLELGCGGFTQLRNIMERVYINITDVTLVDPKVMNYKTITGCTYYGSNYVVNGRAVKSLLVNSTVEEFGKHFVEYGGPFDTVIIMNVLEYSLDAFLFLETIYNSLKSGGLLIFHERWFSDHVRSSKCNTAGFFTNVLQVSKPLLEHFLTFFPDVIYMNTNRTADAAYRSRYWCLNLDDELAFFTIARKGQHVDLHKIK
eukprot:gene28119-33953_t